jgi:type I restriction enzyme S subunit
MTESAAGHSGKFWPILPLGEIAEVKLGKMLDKSKHTTGRRMPYLRNVNVRWDSVDTSDLLEMYFKDDELDRFGLKEGDVVICEGGEPGRAAVWNNSIPNIKYQKAIHRVRFKQPYAPRLLVYLLELLAKTGRLERRFTGSTIKHFTREAIVQLPIPVPPLDEQERTVAEIEKQFTRLDAGVASLKRASVLKAACEGRLVRTQAELARKENRSYETGEQLLQRILKERREKWTGKGKYKEPASANVVDLPTVPEGWTWATMPQLGELNRGKSKHRPRDDAKLYGGPYPFVQTGDIRKSGGTIREHHQNYSEAGLEQSRLWPAGTLCITIAANIAETGILTYPACFPDSIVGFLQGNSPIITRYVELFLRTAKERIESFAPATAQKNINLDVLQKVAIPLPPLAEQARVGAELNQRLSVVDKLEAILNVNVQRGKRLKQSVLASAFEVSPCSMTAYITQTAHAS